MTERTRPRRARTRRGLPVAARRRVLLAGAAACATAIIILGAGPLAPGAGGEQAASQQLRFQHGLLDAGGGHTCAVLNTGAVRCWGSGESGQLGYGDTENVGDDETPASKGDVPLGATATAITAGGNHTCALLTSGSVRCWGPGNDGQLGYGDTETVGDDETPSSKGDVPLGARATAITAGIRQTCALLTSGAVRCWGDGDFGQLGYGDTETVGDDETPADKGDVPLGARAVAIAAGGVHTCALLNTGAVRCWGWGEHGQLGYGDTEDVGDDETPADKGDVPLGARAVAVTAGGELPFGREQRTCALLTDGNVRCWGGGNSGALGYGDTETVGDDETPADKGDVPLGAKAIAITAAPGHTCALLTTGNVRCWGYGWSRFHGDGEYEGGRLGYGDTEHIGDDETPASKGDVPLGARATAITAGGESLFGNPHTCALLTTGNVRCWGYAAFSGLGYGDTESIGDDETPASKGDVPLGGLVGVQGPDITPPAFRFLAPRLHSLVGFLSGVPVRAVANENANLLVLLEIPVRARGRIVFVRVGLGGALLQAGVAGATRVFPARQRLVVLWRIARSRMFRVGPFTVVRLRVVAFDAVGNNSRAQRLLGVALP